MLIHLSQVSKNPGERLLIDTCSPGGSVLSRAKTEAASTQRSKDPSRDLSVRVRAESFAWSHRPKVGIDIPKLCSESAAITRFSVSIQEKAAVLHSENCGLEGKEVVVVETPVVGAG